MNKQILLLFAFLIHLSSRGQTYISLTAPCTREICEKANGKWIKSDDLLHATGLAKVQQDEISKRLDEIHGLVRGVYPEPVGVDAVWHRASGNGLFGASVKYYRNSGDNLTYDFVKGTPVIKFYYTAGFFIYYCANESDNKNKMYTGWPGETGTSLMVMANSIEFILDKNADDTMTVNGRQVEMKLVVKEMKNDYEVLFNPDGGSQRYLLIHRNGNLPYVPVTRKQYLQYCLNYTKNFLDANIAGLELMQQDKEQLKRQKDVMEKEKDKWLQRYRDELEKTTADGLLENPAIVLAMTPMNTAGSTIFTTEKEGGRMLVTENPDYMRKDLPKYVPQVFILKWTWNDSAPQENIRKIIETSFPIEKLQAMIDK
jgi:hypothetical protein